MAQNAPRILIAASGTGGHLFPALFIAEAIKKIASDVEILFIGTGRPLEESIIGSAGYQRYVIKGVQVKNKGLFGKFLFIITLPFLILYSLLLFIRLKPDVLVGVGGYGSVIPVLTAWLLRKPIWLHEAEKTPGMANKFLARFASKISVANLENKFFDNKCVFTGYPVREGLIELRDTKVFNEPLRNILIVGGSLGAEASDQSLIENLAFLKESNFEIFHQSSESFKTKLKQAYAEAGLNAKVVRFIDDMTEAYSWADIVISRSGAGAVNELAVVNIPCILVPLPIGKEQFDNAQILKEHKKAIVVEQGSDFTQALKRALIEISNPKVHTLIRNTEYQPQSLDAAKVIAEGVLNLFETNIQLPHV
ncbi:MAG: UDP-N-acetylglucosamine--N-acetylmuramyl-(pentapeptide) pyrophosphoryl-undecaprenol N-acetylglucosamine transferase [Bdellovibrionota bacterium]